MMVRGLNANVIQRQKRQALAKGNIDELLRLNNLVFGSWQMVAKDDDDDEEDDEEDKDKDTGSDDEDAESSDDEKSDEDATGGDKDKDEPVSKAEYDKLLRRMKAADQRASKAEKAQQDRERKEKSDLENAQSDLQERDTRIAELQSELSALKLNNAFLAANTISWHNPGAALKLAQSDGYMDDVVGDDGTVDEKALKSALQKLAKDHQYLVKKGGDDGSGSGSSGDSAGGRNRNKDDKDAEQQKDARRAPSLNRRRVSQPASSRR
jgi:hypothetical protein